MEVRVCVRACDEIRMKASTANTHTNRFIVRALTHTYNDGLYCDDVHMNTTHWIRRLPPAPRTHTIRTIQINPARKLRRRVISNNFFGANNFPFPAFECLAGDGRPTRFATYNSLARSTKKILQIYGHTPSPSPSVYV